MKKVLIITYYWPPSGGAGVQRWLKFVKYLREFGWEPVVYTHANGEIPVIDHSLEKDIPEAITVWKTPIWEPYALYKKFIGRKKEDKINASFLNEGRKTGLAEKISVWIRGNFFIPDARRFWIQPSVEFISRRFKEEKITHIISSGPPHSMHMIALGLKKRFPELKWIADFRDPWTNIDFYEKLMLGRRADEMHHKMEKEVLLLADKVVSIGKTMSDEFYLINKGSGEDKKEKFEVLTNGYDEEDMVKSDVIPDDKFSLAHVGTLVKDRNPRALWEVLSSLVRENDSFRSKLQIKLVGKVDVFVLDQLKKYGLDIFVKKIDYLPHQEVLLEQKRSSVLLLLVNETKNAKGILTGKFFEYMASERPILAIGPEDGDLAEIIRQTNCGKMSDFHDEKKLKENILDLFESKSQNRNEDAIKLFGRKALTKKLAQLLSSM